MELGPMSAYEQEQVRLKDRELTLKERELTLERRKNWLTMATVIVSVAAALLTYWSTRQSQLYQARAQMELQEKAARDAFELKAAEIAMTGRCSFDAKGRARPLRHFSLVGSRETWAAHLILSKIAGAETRRASCLRSSQQHQTRNIGGQS